MDYNFITYFVQCYVLATFLEIFCILACTISLASWFFPFSEQYCKIISDGHRRK